MDRSQAILIVEDDERQREILTRRLTARYVLPIFEAETGERALALLRQEPVALVLLDLGLPGIQGLDVARAIRALPPPTNQVPIVMVSAYPEGQYGRLAFAAGCDAYYQKPLLDLELFYETVTQLLAGNTEGVRHQRRRENSETLDLS